MQRPLRLRPPKWLYSSIRWRTRAVAWSAAALAGLAAVGFARLSEVALDGFDLLTRSRLWLALALTPAIGMLVVWATRRFVPGAQGSGIPQTIAATHTLGATGSVDRLLSLRIAGGKIGLGALALLGGFSAGREGPTVQISASIMHFAHRLMPHARAIRVQDLALAGGAAGIAAAFNTPLAGITFAVEELGRRLEARTSGVLLSTIIVAGLTAMAIEGNYRYFGQLTVGAVGIGILPAVLAGAAICGVAGGAFSWLLLWPQRASGRGPWRWRAEHPVAFAGACGLAIALIGWSSGGVSFGSGYAITSQAIGGAIDLPWYAPLARFAATVITYFSGIPGGLFAPALAIGAAIGFDLSRGFDFGMSTHPLIAICMTGFLAAVTQSPITSAIIVMEMVDGHSMVISLMATALLAKAISSRFGPELYRQLAVDFLRAPALASDAAAVTAGAGAEGGSGVATAAVTAGANVAAAPGVAAAAVTAGAGAGVEGGSDATR
jgi:H+/Cl- antiporter ClcA